MNRHEPAAEDQADEPAEHLRFATYLRALERVGEADEVDLIVEVLTDPDRAMARSAVLRHLDRRATDLHTGPGYATWAAPITAAIACDPFLTGRLREWSLLRAVASSRPWSRQALLDASDWLQLQAAGTANAGAVELLAEHGRTKRIRTTARAGLKRHGTR
ncbi:hypothetical protein [Streptomyces sp. NPDC057939]|uniref:hypothetical protein n=1 Tax=Streptomyces sp. NPDC057939 TaxID=3346284 RepID=UPI0036ED63A3